MGDQGSWVSVGRCIQGENIKRWSGDAMHTWPLRS